MRTVIGRRGQHKHWIFDSRVSTAARVHARTGSRSGTSPNSGNNSLDAVTDFERRGRFNGCRCSVSNCDVFVQLILKKFLGRMSLTSGPFHVSESLSTRKV